MLILKKLKKYLIHREKNESFSANLTLDNQRVAIVAARFNELIVSKLLGGATDCLIRHGLDAENITTAWVPGAFELPLAAQKLMQALESSQC